MYTFLNLKKASYIVISGLYLNDISRITTFVQIKIFLNENKRILRFDKIYFYRYLMLKSIS